MRLKGVMDLVFCPEGAGGSGAPLWQDPLIRWTTAATLDAILGPPGYPQCAPSATADRAVLLHKLVYVAAACRRPPCKLHGNRCDNSAQP